MRMNLFSGLLGSALVLAAISAPALERFGGEWLTEPSGLGAYGKMEVKMSMKGMLEAVKGKKDEATYLERGQIVQDELQRVLEDYAKGFKGTAGGPTLTIEAELTSLWTGSGAMRAFGGVPGHMDYIITLKDGAKVVGQLDTKQPITSSVKKGAAHAAKQIIKYMKKKMG